MNEETWLREINFPLHDAVVRQDFSTTVKLIDSGYDVNYLHYDRVTPLHCASLAGNLSIVKLLLDKGAWVNAQSIDNSTPLCDACSGGNIECVKTLLNCGASVNPQFCLSSPLHEASLRGYTEIVSLLVCAGAAVNSSDLHYGTPLHAACSVMEPNISCIEVLVKAGSRLNAIKIHKTPLHLIAERSQSVEAAELLLYYGANMYLQDGNGMKPINLCNQNSELAKLLSLHESYPRSLIQCCRLALRNYFGLYKLKSINKFLPSIIAKLLE